MWYSGSYFNFKPLEKGRNGLDLVLTGGIQVAFKLILEQVWEDFRLPQCPSNSRFSVPPGKGYTQERASGRFQMPRLLTKNSDLGSLSVPDT